MIKTIVLLIALLNDKPVVMGVVDVAPNKLACEQERQALQPKFEQPLKCLEVVVPETI